MAAEKKTPTRIYAVTNKETKAVRLVRATQAGPARNHVAKDNYDVHVATQDDLVTYAATVKVETAGADVTE